MNRETDRKRDRERQTEREGKKQIEREMRCVRAVARSVLLFRDVYCRLSSRPKVVDNCGIRWL